MKIAIWGATSFIGRAFASHCMQRGHDVLLISRGDLDIPPAQHARCDLLAEKPLPSLKGYDFIYYFSASLQFRTMPSGLSDTFGVNTWGALRAAQQAIQDGCRFFFYASTGNVYQPSFHPLSEKHPVAHSSLYASSKIAAEEALRLCSSYIPVCCLRIFGPYGPGQKALPSDLIRRVRAGQAVILHPSPDGDCDGLRLSYIYIKDLAQILEQLALLTESKVLPPVLNIAGPEAYSIREFCDTYGAIAGIAPIYTLSEEMRSFDLMADIGKLQQLLDFAFTPLRSGLQTLL